MGGYIAIGVLVVLVLILVVSCIHVVQQSKAYVVERLGSFSAVWGNGLHWKWPFIERVVKKISLKEQVADFDPQPVITKDNVTMQIDTVIYFQITDPKLYTYGVEYPMSAMENLTATTLRNIIGEMELDQSLTSRDTINAKMRAILDEATDPWGIKVNRVELKNILPPREIQNAMEKQMKAERERRESILQAEGEKASKVLIAEGEKQSVLLQADAAKQARILQAEGEATAILKVQQAMADSLKLLNEAAPNDQVIKLKALEALEKVADGKATKIIIPSEIQDAMERQMKAERERREAILQAEGKKQSQILVAEGEKQSVILRADAAKQAAIMKAEGEAEAIMKVQQATAEALKLLNEANPNEQVVKIKALEAFQAAADGKATKIIIPSEIQSLAGLAEGLKAVVDSEEPKAAK